MAALPRGKSPHASPGSGLNLHTHTCVEQSGGRGFWSLRNTDGLTGGGQYNTLQNKLENDIKLCVGSRIYQIWEQGQLCCWPQPHLQSGMPNHTPIWSRSHDVCPNSCLHVLTYILSSCPSVTHAYLFHLEIWVMPILLFTALGTSFSFPKAVAQANPPVNF